MADFAMPEKWTDAQKLFPHQVGFTCPPFDYDAGRKAIAGWSGFCK